MKPETYAYVMCLVSAANVGFAAATWWAYRRFVRFALREQMKTLTLLMSWASGDPAAMDNTMAFFKRKPGTK